ncbi:MAG: hypothetical protein WC933_01720 [Candidatus Paceibacterota bacterium]
MRSIVIIVGLIVCSIVIILLPISLILWLALPIITAWLIVYGLILIIFS